MNDKDSKILVTVIIWVSAVAGYICSLYSAKSPRVLAIGNTFGGGVLLAAGLVHMANDSIEDFDGAPDGSWSKKYDYPWGAFFVCLGFLTTLFVEEIVLYILEKTWHKHGSLLEPLIDGDTEPWTECNSDFVLKKKSTLSATMMSTAMQDHGDHDHGAQGVIERGMAVAFVFLLAISCHSFLAGLGVGAMTGPGLWSGMLAIIAHKGLATFTLSTCFIKANCPQPRLTFYILVFSLVTPVGIICGSLLSTDDVTEGILVGLAGGSFLYIGVLEVISKEMENQMDKLYKLLVLLLGWGLMSSLAIWV